MSTAMISLMAMKMIINKKYNEGEWMGSFLPLQCCSGLRKIDGGPPQTDMNNGGGGALEDDDVRAWKRTMMGREVEGRH